MGLEKICLKSNLLQGGKMDAYIIGMPSTCKYKEYSFWSPGECTKFTKKYCIIEIYFDETFKFKLEKYNSEPPFGDVIDEITISAEEFKECFRNS